MTAAVPIAGNRFVIIGGAMIVMVNLLVDILYIYIDPRIRYS